MGKYIDFATLWGRLGNCPGDIGLVQGEALFRCAMKCKEGSLFKDVAPVGGLTTAVLGTAAKNLDGKLLIEERWNGQHPHSHTWFNRALKTYALDPLLVKAGDPDFVLLRGLVKSADVVADCKGYVFVLGELVVADDDQALRVIEQGAGYVFVDCNKV